MRISLLNVSLLAAIALALPVQSSFAETDPEVIALLKKMEARIAELESAQGTTEAPAADAAMARRIAELESRLEEQEQETKEVKVLASSSAVAGADASLLGNQATFDILAGSAWRNLRWTHEDQWEDIKIGITEQKVIEILGYPPRSLESLKPRVDKVYWYEASIRDWNSQVRGKISFRKGRVVSFQKPDFKELSKAPAAGATQKARRLP